MNNKWVCCICGGEFTGWGNNPYPVVKDEDAQCCDACNSERVLPARIAMLYDKRRDVDNDR